MFASFLCGIWSRDYNLPSLDLDTCYQQKERYAVSMTVTISLCEFVDNYIPLYRLFVNLAKHNVRKDFLANRVVKYWNYPPVDVDFSSINCFKRNLDKTDFTDCLIIQ